MPVREEETLVVKLLCKIHKQASIAYPGKKKIIALVKAYY
jgi:hypothetical protein